MKSQELCGKRDNAGSFRPFVRPLSCTLRWKYGDASKTCVYSVFTSSVQFGSKLFLSSIWSITFENRAQKDCKFCPFLGVFAKLRRAIMSFVMSVRPSVCLRLPLDGFSWNLIVEYFRNSVHIHVSLKSRKNNGYFIWRPMYVYDILLSFSYNEKCFG